MARDGEGGYGYGNEPMTKRERDMLFDRVAPQPDSPEPSAGARQGDADEAQEVFFCANCRVAGVSVDEDGMCVMCGVDTILVTLASRLRAHTQGDAPSSEDLFHDGYRRGYEDAKAGHDPDAGRAWCDPSGGEA